MSDMSKYYEQTTPPSPPRRPKAFKMVFVFGSNLAGVHGAGAAKAALERHGAKYGMGVGRSGNSYALPTKDERIETLPMSRIEDFVTEFIDYAKANPGVLFQVTQIGCGLAGLKSQDIAPMFFDAPENCLFDEAWKEYLGDDAQYWGTF